MQSTSSMEIICIPGFLPNKSTKAPLCKQSLSTLSCFNSPLWIFRCRFQMGQLSVPYSLGSEQSCCSKCGELDSFHWMYLQASIDHTYCPHHYVLPPTAGHRTNSKEDHCPSGTRTGQTHPTILPSKGDCILNFQMFQKAPTHKGDSDHCSTKRLQRTQRKVREERPGVTHCVMLSLHLHWQDKSDEESRGESHPLLDSTLHTCLTSGFYVLRRDDSTFTAWVWLGSCTYSNKRWLRMSS